MPVTLISLLLSSSPICCAHPLVQCLQILIALQRGTIPISSAMLPSHNTMDIWKTMKLDLYLNHQSNWFTVVIMNSTPPLKKNLSLNFSSPLQPSSFFSPPLLIPTSQCIVHTISNSSLLKPFPIHPNGFPPHRSPKQLSSSRTSLSL